jgi:hypothetical protein
LNENRYVTPRTPTRAELDAALDVDDVEALREMVVAVTALGDDPGLATNLVRRLITHEDEFVRGNAVLGVGHIARRFGSVTPDLLQKVRAAAIDPSEHVRGHAASAADDLQMFLGVDVRDEG